MNRKQKANYLDKFNEKIENYNINHLKEVNEKNYKLMINELTNLKLNNVKITKKTLISIANKYNINFEQYKKTLINSYLSSAVSIIIENKTLAKKEFNPSVYFALASLISLKDPVKTAVNISKVSNSIINKKPLFIPKLTFISLNEYVGDYQTKNIKDITSKYKKLIDKADKQYKISLLNDYNNKIQSILKSQEELELAVAEAKKKMTNELDYRIKRKLETEAHQQLEFVKREDAIKKGFNFKIWNTQQDKKVRATHDKLQGFKTRINKKFRIGADWGLYPGDINISAKERINCRCFLTYSRI